MTPAQRRGHGPTHTFTAVFPITDEGMDMPMHALVRSAEPEVSDLMFDLHATPCGAPSWKVEPFRSATTGLALVMRVPAREWPADLAALDVREARA